MAWRIVICCNTVCHGEGRFFSLMLPVYRRAGRRWHSACWTRWWWWSWSSPLWSSTSPPTCVQIASTRTTSSPHMSRSELYHCCLSALDVSDFVIAVSFCFVSPRPVCFLFQCSRHLRLCHFCIFVFWGLYVSVSVPYMSQALLFLYIFICFVYPVTIPFLF